MKTPSPTSQGPSFAVQYLPVAAASSPSTHLGFQFSRVWFFFHNMLHGYTFGYLWLPGLWSFCQRGGLEYMSPFSSLHRYICFAHFQQSDRSKSMDGSSLVTMLNKRGICYMIPFYIGKLFRQANASDEVYSKFGIGKDKVQKNYSNVERFSIGIRNPTAFVAGALGIADERFFAGVCLSGLNTLPIQLGIGFMLRERPMVAVTTVATAVGIWTLFPYALAACNALFLFVRNQIST